ncbi:MAG: extracellular solute-binding protein [Anaerolineales bacterium]|nr:extracellular solute-binding protein [Anaerolineales bacterium]
MIRLPVSKFPKIFHLICLLSWLALFSACNQSPPSAPLTVSPTQAKTTSSPSAQSTRPGLSATPTETPTPFSRLGLEASDLRGVIVRYWHIWSGPAGEVVDSLVDEFNLTNQWGIMVAPVYQGGLDGISASMEAALASGETPDLAVGYLHQALAWNAQQKLVNLRDYVDDPVWGMSLEEQADFYPVFWEQDVVDGRRLGIPAQRSAQLLYYNVTWARELGFSAPPVLPRQFSEQACMAAWANKQDADHENDGAGGWIISTNYSAMLGWMYAFGGDIVKMPEPALDQSVYQFNTPEIEEAFTFLRSLYDPGCAWVAESEYPNLEFARRLGLFATDSVMGIAHQEAAFGQTGNRDQWTVIPFPSPSQNPAIDVYGPSFVMLVSSPERQLASWVFIKWLSSPQNQARMVEASSAFPLRVSTLDFLEGYKNRHPQWAAALQTLPFAHSEPPFQSWGTVRWALSDAGLQLFRSYFETSQIPGLLDFLDQTAAGLHLGLELSGAFDAPIGASTPGATAAIAPPSTPSFMPTRAPNATPQPSPQTTPTR